MWTPQTELLFQNWTSDFRRLKTESRRIYWFWKCVSFCYIPIAVASWIFGAKALAEENKSSHTEDIVLLAVGAATVVLDRMKPKKYKLLYKTRMQTYEKIIHRLELQLARPAATRKAPEELLRKIQAELKVASGFVRQPNANADLAGIGTQEMEDVIIND